MPRYFFDLDDHETDTDEEGQLLAGAEAARVEAVVFAGAYLRDNPDLLADGYRFVVSVRDESGVGVVKVIMYVEPPHQEGRRPNAQTDR